jgi:hypothetical protein
VVATICFRNFPISRTANAKSFQTLFTDGKTLASEAIEPPYWWVEWPNYAIKAQKNREFQQINGISSLA